MYQFDSHLLQWVNAWLVELWDDCEHSYLKKHNGKLLRSQQHNGKMSYEWAAQPWAPSRGRLMKSSFTCRGWYGSSQPWFRILQEPTEFGQLSPRLMTSDITWGEPASQFGNIRAWMTAPTNGFRKGFFLMAYFRSTCSSPSSCTAAAFASVRWHHQSNTTEHMTCHHHCMIMRLIGMYKDAARASNGNHCVQNRRR